MRWARRPAWQQSQSFEAWSASPQQGRMDGWMRGPVEGLVAHLIAQDALRERLSLLLLLLLAGEH